MKKAISITLAGIMFNIEDDAYQALADYLAEIKTYFSSLKGEDEILDDIEVNIAEKLSKKLTAKKKVINIKNIEEVIKILGTVEEIAENTKGEDKDSKKKDSKQSNSEEQKRLYRNPDNVVIAGVASGIAAYFSIDPVFIRIVFILLTFLHGAGIVVYLVLWIIVPKASNNLQKLEMSGKPVNLSELKSAVKNKSAMLKREGTQALDNIKKNKSVIYEVLNFPIKILERVVYFTRKILGAMGPVFSVFFGSLFMTAGFFGILGLTIFLGAMIFYIDSPYIISDLPLAGLVNNPLYYLAAVAVYLIALVPVIFLLTLGLTMTRRKNSFRLFATISLVGIWAVAIAAGVVASGELVPQMMNKLAEIEATEKITRNYDYADFQKLYIGGKQEVTVKQGDEFAINISGQAKDLDRLNFNVEDGQLQITQRPKDYAGKLCLFCFDREVTTEIIMPKLDSFVGIGSSGSEIMDLNNDLYVSLGERASLKANLQGQNIEASLSGVDSLLGLTGSTTKAVIKMDGRADVHFDDVQVDQLDLDMSVFARGNLSGKVNVFNLKTKGSARLEAFDFTANNTYIKAADYSQVEVSSLENLAIIAQDSADILYKGEPKELNEKSLDHSLVRQWDSY